MSDTVLNLTPEQHIMFHSTDECALIIAKDGVPTFPMGPVAGAHRIKNIDGGQYRPIYRMALRAENRRRHDE